MEQSTKLAFVVTAASVTQTLPYDAVAVVSVAGLDGAATSIAFTNYPVVTTTPGTGDVQFTGSANTPSKTLTFNAALTAAGMLLVTYVPVGAVPAAV